MQTAGNATRQIKNTLSVAAIRFLYTNTSTLLIKIWFLIYNVQAFLGLYNCVTIIFYSSYDSFRILFIAFLLSVRIAYTLVLFFWPVFRICFLRKQFTATEALLASAKKHGMEVHGYAEEIWNEEVENKAEHFRRLIMSS